MSSDHPQAPGKPGHKTSEFAWIALTTIGAVAAAISGVLPAVLAAKIAAGGAAAYALARGIAKARKVADK